MLSELPAKPSLHSILRSHDCAASTGTRSGIQRLTSDVSRFAADLDELGPPAPGHRPAPAPEDLEEIPDEPYDESMWSDAEHEGFGAPDRHAP